MIDKTVKKSRFGMKGGVNFGYRPHDSSDNRTRQFAAFWRRREGVEPSGDLTTPRLVLKTSGTTGHLPSPL